MASQKFWEDLRWGERHHTELLRHYRDKWIAIRDGHVVASGLNLAEVEREAVQKTGNRQVPVLFIDCGEHIYGQDS